MLEWGTRVINKREIGSKYEDVIVDYIKDKGYIVLEKNYRVKQGEIDIIAKDKGYLVFIEVKDRKDNKTGSPLEAITYSKQKTISKVALYYMYSHGIGENQPVRFDVACIEGEDIEYIENAFMYVG